MSLINEALKKAQRQRTEEPAPLPPPAAPVTPAAAPSAPAIPIVKRRPPMPARTLVILLVGGISVLFMGGVLVFLFLADNSAPPHASSPVIATRPTAPVPTAPTPELALPPAPAPAPAPTPVVEIKLPAIIPPTVVPTPAPEPLPAPAPVVVAPAEPVNAGPRVPTANPQVYEFLEKLRIAGIRVSPTDPKVIMNDRVFRLNDIVDRVTQLRLHRIDADTLIFIDASGFEYKKSF